MTQEFHLHTELVKKPLVKENVPAEATPVHVRRRLHHNAVHMRRRQQHRRANIIHIGNHLAATGLELLHVAVDFARNTDVALVP